MQRAWGTEDEFKFDYKTFRPSGMWHHAALIFPTHQMRYNIAEGHIRNTHPRQNLKPHFCAEKF